MTFAQTPTSGDFWNPRGVEVLARTLAGTYGADHEVVVYEASPYPIVDALVHRCRIADLARLDVILEPEGMGVAAAGKEAVGELEQAQQGISAHGRGRPRWD